MEQEQDYFNKAFQGLANRLGRSTGRLALSLGKTAIKGIGKILLSILIHTFPVWFPILLILLLAYSAYLIVLGFPMSAAEENASNQDKVSTFYAFSKNEEFLKENEDLFDKYKEIANRWDDGLSDYQKQQVETHAMSWAILMAVDRITHDPVVLGEGKEIEIKPEKVFEDLRPKFEWEESTITIEREKKECKEVIVKDKNGKVIYDEKGNPVTKEECEIVIKKYTDTVRLVTEANIIEGEFVYHYKTVTEKQNTSDGYNQTVTKEEVDYIEYPAHYFQPLYDYLASKGIKTEEDIELVIELAQIYDTDYNMSLALRQNLDYTNYPVIKGVNDWLWITPSTRVTSPYGYRSTGFHAGIDIGAVQRGIDGDPIWSMADGRVTYAGWASGYGLVVYIDHDDSIQTRYGHLSRINVKTGDYIKQKELLGLMGNTGRSTGTHLHFEIRFDDIPYDPAYYFPILK